MVTVRTDSPGKELYRALNREVTTRTPAYPNTWSKRHQDGFVDWTARNRTSIYRFCPPRDGKRRWRNTIRYNEVEGGRVVIEEG